MIDKVDFAFVNLDFAEIERRVQERIESGEIEILDEAHFFAPSFLAYYSTKAMLELIDDPQIVSIKHLRHEDLKPNRHGVCPPHIMLMNQPKRRG